MRYRQYRASFASNFVTPPMPHRLVSPETRLHVPANSNFPKPLNSAGLGLQLLYIATGDSVRAEPLLIEALEIKRRALGDQHPAYAEDLNSLAALYAGMGDLVRAEPLYIQALLVAECALGEQHFDYATGLFNLAWLYQTMGDLARAEPLYIRAREIRRRTSGDQHPDYADSLNNLAVRYHEMGDFERAQEFCIEALGVARRAFGEQHSKYARCLSNLATLCQAMGDFARAEFLYLEALEIWHRALGDHHPNYARILSDLATLYTTIGDLTRAEPLLVEARTLHRRALREQSPDYAKSLGNLAAVYWAAGDLGRAEPLFLEAMVILRRAVGEQHPDYAISLYNLGIIREAMDRSEEAFSLLQRALAVQEQSSLCYFTIASERQRSLIVEKLAPGLAQFLSLLNKRFPQSQGHLQSGLDVLLRRKGLGAEALATQRDAILGGRYPHLQSKLEQLTLLRGQIARRTWDGTRDRDPLFHFDLLADWGNQREALESELARQIPELKLQERLRAVDRFAVAAALPNGSVLLEFIRLDTVAFDGTGRKKQWPPARYLAFLLQAGKPDQVAMEDLGDAVVIDAAIATFLQAMTQDPAGDSYAAPGRGLRQLVFDPIVSRLGNVTRLYLSPDGDLNLLPFETLPTEENSFLADHYQISYLSTGRELLRHQMEPAGKLENSLVAVNPDFRLAASADPVAGPTPEADPPAAMDRGGGRASRDLGRGGWAFKPLPAAEEEGRRVALRVHDAETWTGAAVLESRLKRVRSPRILHLATHGFFLEDQELDLSKNPLGSSFLGIGDSFRGPVRENPMLGVSD